MTAESATKTEAVIKTATTCDSAVLRMRTEALKAKAGQAPSPEELAKKPPMKVVDETRYVLDRKLGIMREGRLERRAEVGAAQRVERWEIELLKKPKR